MEQASRIQRVRGWLRSDLRVMRWVLLGLYLAVVIAIIAMALLGDNQLWLLVLLGINLFCQGLFVLGSGTMRLCKPVHRGRLLIPVVLGALMFVVLLGGLMLSTAELVKLDAEIGPLTFWGFVVACWIIWGTLIFARAKQWQRFKVLGRIAALCFAGSLAELLATVPSHLIVRRRPGCLVGIFTMLGIIAGLNVMFFSFGPGVVVLFLRPRLRREQKEIEGVPFCEKCGYDLRASVGRCPECGTAFVALPGQVHISPPEQ